MSYHHHHHHHSQHHNRPLGMIKNHFFQFDNMKKVEERLRPHVHKPLQGIKHVQPQYQTMNNIAPDFNNQKITFSGTDSILPEKTASNPNRTTNTHFTRKRNEELILSALAILSIGGFLLYIKR
jgi:SRSO17 transposase